MEVVNLNIYKSRRSGGSILSIFKVAVPITEEVRITLSRLSTNHTLSSSREAPTQRTAAVQQNPLHLTRLHFQTRSFVDGVFYHHSLTLANTLGTKPCDVRQYWTTKSILRKLICVICVQSLSVPAGLRPRTVWFQLHPSSKR